MWVYEIDGRYIEPQLVDVSHLLVSDQLRIINDNAGYDSFPRLTTLSIDSTQPTKAGLSIKSSSYWPESKNLWFCRILL